MGLGTLRRDVERWGATDDEVAATYPCDALDPGADMVLWRAVTVHASPAVVFRWLCQLRVAPYSYDWIDNFGRQSPRHLIEGLDDLEVGQRFVAIFTLADFEQDRSLTIRGKHWAFGAIVITYQVNPDPAGCRLVVKLRGRPARGPIGVLGRALLPAGDLVMMRKQLNNFAHLAETVGAAGVEPATSSL